jgi:urea transport system substrate-binding protein
MTPNNKPPSSAPVKPTGPSESPLAESAAPHQDETHPVSRQAAVCPTPPHTWIGKRLGKYQNLGQLGRGAMGVVLKGYDPLIDREVAIKLLADDLVADATALGRFLYEARAAGKINHPNVVAIYDICQEETLAYLVLEYVSGGSLDEKLVGFRGLPVLEATQVMIDACKGAGAAHAAGLIHRDIKPANFMRAADGSLKVADFGLAKRADGLAQQFTQHGMVVGTPSFMSPEQCEGKPLDRRSDIYSLGAAYYNLLTGETPYMSASSVPEVMYSHCHGPIPDPRAVNPTLPSACSKIIAKAMAKKPDERYQTTDEMLADLQGLAATLSGQAPVGLLGAPRPRSLARIAPWVAAAVFLGALVTLVASGVFSSRPKETLPEAMADPVVVPQPKGEPVKVGVLHSLTGTMAQSETVVVDAVQFAIDEVNQSGGVLGRQVEAVVADGRSDPAVFEREAERLITEEKVCTVFGCWTSASRKTVRTVFENHDHLLMYPTTFEGLELSPNIVYLGAAPNQQILPALEWAVKEKDKRRFFFIGSDYIFPHAAEAIMRDHLAGPLEDWKASIIDAKYVPLGERKFAPIIDAIRKAKPDMILNTINGDSNTDFFRALREAEITPRQVPTLSFSVGEPELTHLNAGDVAGDYAAWCWFRAVKSPENEAFVRAFEKKYPGRSLTDPMQTAYFGVKLWAKAVNEAKSLEPKAIRLALRNQKLQAPGGPVRIDSDTQYTWLTPRIGRVKSDGRFELVWPAPAPVKPKAFPLTRKSEEWLAFLFDLQTEWGGQWSAPAKSKP